VLVIPAIDLKDGRCVRLRQGDLQRETVYSDDPPAMARRWEAQGARWLHLVDLNGAVDGNPKNQSAIEAIVRAVSVPVQVGGGIRSVEMISRYLSIGVARVVLGTAVLEQRTLLDEACAQFPDRILVGIDARNGQVAVHGWTSLSATTTHNLLAQLKGYALAGIIYTDISRDGMLEGPNLAGLKDIASRSPVRVIASGGISRVEDVQAVKAIGPSVTGVIVGKALYDGKLDLRAALVAAAGGAGEGQEAMGDR
jgi:phosphoribosylformimino-5-aminoimidazole carboxamide ribotide isomerase